MKYLLITLLLFCAPVKEEKLAATEKKNWNCKVYVVEGKSPIIVCDR